MRPFWLFVFVPVIALAQATIPTEFPPEAVPFTPDALKERIAGRTFTFKPVAGDAVRIQYQETHAFFNVGSASDSGKWRVEGSSVCYDWRKFPGGCSEHRKVGDLVYVKRFSTGEVVVLQPK